MNRAHSRAAFRCTSLAILISQALASFGYGQDDPSEMSGNDRLLKDYKVVDVPDVKRIVMFNSGLAQMIHEGSVDGNCQIRMQFDTHDISDVLRSLVFDDASGLVRAVEYNPAPDSVDIAARKLGPAMTVAQMLQKYRGESVVLKTAAGEFKGSILSVENRQVDDGVTEMVTLLGKFGITSFAINDVTAFDFEDLRLRKELAQAMQGLKKSRTNESKELVLLFEGDGKRLVRFSYLIECPVWRMTYRLDLREKRSPLQGWAHVDNGSNLNWNEIQLELRSGKPQSYHVELFSPVYAQRNSMGLEVFDLNQNSIPLPRSATGFKSRSLGRGGGGGGGFGGGGGGGFGGMGGGRSFGGRRIQPPKAEPDVAGAGERFDINSAIESAASVGRTEEMVVLKIEDAVSLSAGRSAMLPVLTEAIPVQLYSMFDTTQSRSSASMVGQIQNTTKTPFVPGPLTIYRDGNFVGDAAISRVDIDQKSTVVFGMDPSVSLQQETLPKNQVVKAVKLADGDVVVDSETIHATNYTIRNDDAESRQILLKLHLHQSNVDPQPTRQTGQLPDAIGFFELTCDANSSLRQPIRQFSTSVQRKAIGSLTQSNLKDWEQAKALVDSKIRDRVLAIESAARELAEIEAERNKEQQKLDVIRQEQERITDIVRAIEAGSAVSEKFLDALTKTEDDLTEQRQVLEKIETRVEEKKQALLELKK